MKFKKNKVEDKVNNAALFVSLYLVILSFFIMLTMNARFDENRTNDALKSVQSSFRADFKRSFDKLLDKSSIGPEGNDLTVEEELAKVRNVIRDLIKLTDVNPEQNGNRLQLKVPKSLFYKAGGINIRSEQSDLMKALIKEMTAKVNGMKKDIEFVIGIDKYFMADKEERMLDINRAGMFAEYLEDNGVNDNNILVGISSDHPDEVIMSFEFNFEEEQEGSNDGNK